jgi:NitT/TauT family transport system substrate-binding protein
LIVNRTLIALLSTLAIVFAGCTSSASSSPAASPSSSASAVQLKVGLGYIPGVQFAPFYLAQQSGAYAAAGLDVTLQNQIDPDLISLVGTGELDLALADGTSMIPAVSKGIPVRYLATIYGVLPNVVIARTDAGIMSPSDLKGKRVGTPGQYGSGYLTLLGILGEASLKVSDISLNLYPDFGQTQALIGGTADATTGYANNDLVQAKAAGIEVEVFYAAAAAPFAGPGLISAPATITSKRDAVRAFIATTLEAMRKIKANPELGVDAAAKIVPEIAATPAARANALAVMKATVEVWAGPLQESAGYGAISLESWTTSISFMKSIPGQQVLDGLKASDIVDASLLP